MYNAQEEVLSRERYIAEAASPGTFTFSADVVEGMVNKWQDLANKNNALIPVLQVCALYM